MNKRIDYSNLGGFPATQKTFQHMQDSYRNALSGIASLCGDKVIVSGVQVVGGTVTPGWIAYNGELVPFLSGGIVVSSSFVIVEESAEAVTFQDNMVRNVYFTKTARLGIPGTFPFSQLRRLTSLQDLERWLPGDLKEVDCTPEYIVSNFDVTGLGLNDRKGWAICNGQNGTKNRGGRVSVGMNFPAITDDPNDNTWDIIYNTVGSTGGEKRHKLTIDEMPAHKHSFNGSGDKSPDDTSSYGSWKNNNDIFGVFDAQMNATGGDMPHENRQPFMVTLFIQKL